MTIYLIFPFALLLTTIFHYAVLKKLTVFINKAFNQSITLVSVIVVLFIAHTIEIAIYAVIYYYAGELSGAKVLQAGSFQENLNALYFSFLAYSSLGSSDLVAMGWVRILYGFEALNGLLLITWSASFTFLTMNIVWNCNACNKEQK